MAKYHKVLPRYIVDANETGFAFKRGKKLTMDCLPEIKVEQQTIRHGGEGLHGFTDPDGDPDKRYLKKVTTESISETTSTSSRTGSATITEEYSLDRDRMGGPIALKTGHTETQSRSFDDQDSQQTCGDNFLEFTRSFNYTHLFEKLQLGEDDGGFILNTRSKMRQSYNAYRCGVDDSFEGYTEYSFVSTGMPTTSVVYSEEMTEQDAQDRYDETIERGKDVWAQYDGPLGLRISSWSYPISKFQMTAHHGLQFFDIINAADADSDTGSFGSIGTLVFDEEAWETAIQNRLNYAKQEFGYQDDVTVTDEEGEEVEVNYYDNEIAELQSDIETLNEEEQAELDGYDQAKGEYEAAEATLQEKASLLETLEWRLQFGSEGLSEDELSSLQDEIDAASEAVGEADDALEDLDFPGVSSGSPHFVWVNTNTTSYYRIEREKLNLEIAEMTRLKALQTAYFDPVEAAILGNKAYPNFDFKWAENDVVQVDSDAEPYIVGRYRITLEVDGAYDFSDGSRTVTVEWREQTATTDEEGETTYTYEEKSEDFVVAAAGRYVGAWHEPSVPATANTNISVVEPEAKKLPRYSNFIIGTGARKLGVYGYTPSSPPKVYRREVFSGEFPGCEALDLTAKTYSGKREAPNHDPSFDVIDMLVPNGETVPLWQPATGEFNALAWNAGGQRISYVEQTDTTRVYYREAVQCGENELTDELVGTLEGEITTEEIITSVDDYIAAVIDYIEADYPIGEAPDYPEDPEMFVQDEIWNTRFGRNLLLWEDAFPTIAWRLLEADELGYFRRSGYIEVEPIDDNFPEEGSATVSYEKHIYEVATGNVTVTDETIDVALETSEGEEPTKIELEPAMGQVMWISDLHYDELPGSKGGNPKITAIEADATP